MEAISYNQARDKFSSLMEKVCEDHDPLIITREEQPSVVIMSLEDYNSLEETLYLLKSPNNAKRLNQAIAEVESGNVFKHDLIEK